MISSAPANNAPNPLLASASGPSGRFGPPAVTYDLSDLCPLAVQALGTSQLIVKLLVRNNSVAVRIEMRE